MTEPVAPTMAVDATKAFADALREQVIEQARAGGPHSDELACLVALVAELFEEAGIVEEPELCQATGRLNRSDWEVSGWALPGSDAEDQGDVSILTGIWVEDAEAAPLGLPDVRRQFERAALLLRGALDGRAADVSGPAEILAFVKELSDRSSRLRRVTIHVVTNGSTRRLRELESVTVGGIEICCSVWDVDRLSRLTDPKQEEIEVDVLEILAGRGLSAMSVPTEGVPYSAYLCIIPGIVLCNAYEKYGQRLLELNVRAFLTQRGKVNQGIRDTILREPQQFFPYNNGLALIAREVEVRRGTEGVEEITKIRGLQVVNGGQTTASLHRAWKIDGATEQIKKTFVQAKLIVITTASDDNEGFVNLVRSISRYANSQNAVKGDDLEANQPWHVAFEQLSRATWTPSADSKWFYERSRGSYAVAKSVESATRTRQLGFERLWPRSQVYTKTDLAKAVNAWGQRPDIVSLGGQKNFLAFMKSLDDQLHRPRVDVTEYKRTVGMIILFRDATRIVRDLRDAIPAYRANVVAYLVSYLSHRMQGALDFLAIWERQATPSRVQETLKDWAVPIADRIVSSAGTRNVTEWCKKEACWVAVRSLDLTAPDGLERYAATNPGERPARVLASSDAEDISECLRLQPHEWGAVQDWVFRSAGVHFAVKGIIQTLRLQALNNWARRPTERQARPAAKVIRRWREETGGSES